MLYSTHAEKESKRRREKGTVCVGGQRAAEPRWILKETHVSQQEEGCGQSILTATSSSERMT